MADIHIIYNFLQLSDSLATAGQPSEEELESVATEGYEVVINLALADASYSLLDEEVSVLKLGMEYVHIPVIWKNPIASNLDSFFESMRDYQGKKRFIHCAANKRVSSFIALHRIIRKGWDYDDAMRDMHRIWQPNTIWTDFIKNELSARLTGR
jgi:protein tyrosine phosphatase (PTP) superfamily phosphohydrolase (DUF442 family)